MTLCKWSQTTMRWKRNGMCFATVYETTHIFTFICLLHVVCTFWHFPLLNSVKEKKKIVSRLNKIFTLADVYWACFSSSPTSGRGVFLTPKPVLVVLHGWLLFTAAESESILSVHELHAVSHKGSFTHTRCYICTSQHMTMCCPAKFPVIAVLKVFYVTVFS